MSEFEMTTCEDEVFKYEDAAIYCIKLEGRVVYVGSTQKNSYNRWLQHRKVSVKKASKLHKALREIGRKHFEMDLIEDFPCQTKQELLRREGYWITHHRTVEDGYNVRVAGRTRAERVATKFSCGCGVTCSYTNRTHHLRTKAHLAWENSSKETS